MVHFDFNNGILDGEGNPVSLRRLVATPPYFPFVTVDGVAQFTGQLLKLFEVPSHVTAGDRFSILIVDDIRHE